MSTISKGLDRHDRALIHDDLASDLLESILLELRKMNLYLQILTDEEVEDGDVE